MFFESITRQEKLNPPEGTSRADQLVFKGVGFVSLGLSHPFYWESEGRGKWSFLQYVW